EAAHAGFDVVFARTAEADRVALRGDDRAADLCERCGPRRVRHVVCNVSAPSGRPGRAPNRRSCGQPGAVRSRWQPPDWSPPGLPKDLGRAAERRAFETEPPPWVRPL